MMDLWTALLIGVVFGFLAVAFGIATSGTDAFDFIVTPAIIIVLALILGPVFARGKHRRLRTKQPAPTLMQQPLMQRPQGATARS